MTDPARTPGPLRRALAALRPSRLELKIGLALGLVILPAVGALYLAVRTAEETVFLGLDPRVVDRVESIPSLYGDLFRAKKQLWAEQARTIALGLPRDRARAEAYLSRALERTPGLLRASWVGPEGAPIASAERPPPEGQWREAPARVALPGGAWLDCAFAIEARLFAELDESRELAELLQGLDAMRTEIRRSFVRTFGALLAVMLIAAAFGVWLAHRTTRRVGDLERAVRRLAAGDLAVQVDAGKSADEIASLAHAFNSMVTEVRESRDRIVYLEKISGWQEVARRLAHEIKNPLTPMKLAFQQLEARWKESPAREGDADFGALVKDAGEIVRDEIGTLQRLVDEFSAFAKLPEVRPEPADLGDFVDEFLRTSPQVQEGADVEVVRAAGECPVSLDRTLMRRVLANLCANAAEAVRPARARVHIGVSRARDAAVLTVADEGPGIERTVRERIFDPYFTTKDGGTGLGLAIVKKIVLQHGGEIQVGERPGGGASFSVVLPLRARA